VTEFATSYVVTRDLHRRAPHRTEMAGWGTFLLPAVVIVLLVPFQSTAEEFLFRGWVVQAIAACTLETRKGPIGRAFSVAFRTPWPALIISGRDLHVRGTLHRLGDVRHVPVRPCSPAGWR